ncbi:S8 family peptidase [Haloparvum sedimenti]|uniref:S8 family peptidase n=1 Tax=Haloparvum sedimenti TaxID=1678448 RepID=UPI00071E9835|nr:S8 family serine peptidase [Haloparvum sedimenti]
MNFDRRSLLKGIGAAGVATTFSGLAAAEGGEDPATDRFLIDLREIDRGDVPDDVEIVHDISEIDLLAARGDPAAVPGVDSTTPDVTVYRDDAGAVPENAGPAAEVDKGSGTAGDPAWDDGLSNNELQWDKRAQKLGDLSDRPDDSRTVHDTSTGAGARVAVIDSGVSDAHPDLADVVNAELSANFTTDPYDFRPNGAGDHGTHVAGTVAATNASGDGVLGTAPDAEVVSLRVFSGVEGATGDVIAAIVDAANKGCDAANLSLGYPVPYVDPEEFPFLLDVKEAYERAAAYAREQEMLVVNSAGNDGIDMDAEGVLSLPTEAEGVFGVSATGPIGFLWDDRKKREDLALKRLEDPTSSPAFYTNYGSAVEMSAAGGDADLDALEAGEAPAYYDLVLSTVVSPDGDGGVVPGYGWKAGTSMAAPQVSGAVALVRSLRPDAGVVEVESLLRETATDGEPGGEQYHGAGHLDLRSLVKAAR